MIILNHHSFTFMSSFDPSSRLSMAGSAAWITSTSDLFELSTSTFFFLIGYLLLEMSSC